jgi:hypothetical protein
MTEFWTETRKALSELSFATKTWAMKDQALANISAGKPAFWSTCGNYNALDGQLIDAINQHGSIEAAQEEYAGIFARRGMDPRNEEHLDRLIPLNRAAVMDLLRAYQNVGTFRDADELAARAFKRGWPRYRVRGSLSAPVRGADLSPAVEAV